MTAAAIKVEIDNDTIDFSDIPLGGYFKYENTIFQKLGATHAWDVPMTKRHQFASGAQVMPLSAAAMKFKTSH
jgi:hypothetical protein